MNKYRLEITLVDENNRAVDHYTIMKELEDLHDDVHNRNFNEIIISMVETEQYNLKAPKGEDIF